MLQKWKTSEDSRQQMEAQLKACEKSYARAVHSWSCTVSMLEAGVLLVVSEIQWAVGGGDIVGSGQ